MVKDVLGWGIVGLGMGYNRCKKVVEAPGAELRMVCSIEPGRAEEVGKELGAEWTMDYDEMLARDDIDVIGVMTPSGTHCDFAIRALEAGKHCHTTKPMDIHVAKCDAAIAAAEKAGKILAVDFDLRYEPINHQIRMALRQGKLGDLLCCDLIMKWYRAQSYYDGGSPPGWRSRTVTEGGSIANQGVHFVDLLQWFMGPVKSVQGRSATFGHAIETEDQTMAIMEFQGNIMGAFHTTTCSVPNLGSYIEINGSQGTLLWKDSEISLFHSAVDPDLKLTDITVDPTLPKNIVEDMVSAITRGTPVQCSGYEGRKSVAIFEAIYESSRTGQVVQL